MKVQKDRESFVLLPVHEIAPPGAVEEREVKEHKVSVVDFEGVCRAVGIVAPSLLVILLLSFTQFLYANSILKRMPCLLTQYVNEELEEMKESFIFIVNQGKNSIHYIELLCLRRLLNMVKKCYDSSTSSARYVFVMDRVLVYVDRIVIGLI